MLQLLQYLQNPIIFSIAMGIFVASYMWLEDSFTDKGIANKTKYIRAFLITTVAINVIQTYANKPSNGISQGYQQSYSVGNAPF